MLKIELSKNEYSYLCQASFLDDKYRRLLFLGQRDNGNYLIEISEDQADEMRDLCGEQLQIVGLDENYELTQEGQILDTLVDKLYV